MGADRLVAALVIDMQEDFFSQGRLAERRAALVRSLNELLAICREAGIPLVWVRQEWARDLSDAMLDARRRGARITIAGTKGAAILAELDHRRGDFELVKKRYSPFFRTGLDDLLQRMRATTLIIAGINTHACVRTAVIDAYQRDYEVVLARDCVDSQDAGHHDMSLTYLERNVCEVASNEEIRAKFSNLRT